MARRFSNKLVAKQVIAITKPGKHSDGNGLYLLVKPNGNRSWVLILIGGGQRREMGLGTPEAVSLAVARKLAADAKAAFAEGRDPIAERVEARPKIGRAGCSESAGAEAPRPFARGDCALAILSVTI
jgi:hypothetical protein